MGLFDSVSSFFTSSEQTKALNRVKDVFNPFGDSVSLVNPFTGSSVSAPGLKTGITATEVAGAVVGAELIGGAGTVSTLGGGALRAGSSVLKFGTSSLTKGILTFGVAPAVTLAVIKKPENVPKAVSNYGNFVNNASNLVNDPTVDNALKTAKDNPYITGATVLGILGGGAGGVTGLFSAYETKRSADNTAKNTDAITKPAPIVVNVPPAANPQITIQQASAPVVPMSSLPAVAAPVASTKKKAKKNSKKKKKAKKKSKKKKVKKKVAKKRRK